MDWGNYKYESEVEIFWVKPEYKKTIYLKENVVVAFRRKALNIKKFRCGNRGIIAYSTLKPDATRCSRAFKSRFYRRIWYLANHDPYNNGDCPWRSALPSSIIAGQPSVDAYGNI